MNNTATTQAPANAFYLSIAGETLKPAPRIDLLAKLEAALGRVRD